MLATVTPLAERARGHRYRTRRPGSSPAASPAGPRSVSVWPGWRSAVRAAGPPVLAVAAVAAAASCSRRPPTRRLGGFRLPVHHRQVNERWLDQFRPWVYGAGFGWQIGTGLVTYIKTAALYLMIVLAALTASPAAALAIGALFGLVRGLAVLLGRGITSAATLAAFHRRFTELGPVVLGVVVAGELACRRRLRRLRVPWAAVAAGPGSSAGRPRRPGGRGGALRRRPGASQRSCRRR